MPNKQKPLALSVALALGLSSPIGWTADSFIPLADLAGGGFFSQAFAVSGDGAVVVGRGTSANGNELECVVLSHNKFTIPTNKIGRFFSVLFLWLLYSGYRQLK